MKKIFTLLAAVLLCSNMYVSAQDYYGGTASFPSVSYLELAQNGSDNEYRIRMASNGSACLVHNSFVVNSSNPRSINGTWNLGMSSGYMSDDTNFVRSSAGNMRNNPNGTISFTWKNINSNGWPVYRVVISVYAYGYVSGYGWVYWNYQLNQDLEVRPYKSTSINVNNAIDLTDYYTISVSSNSTSYGTVSGGGTFANGASRTITASANSGYHFVCWKKGNTVISSSPNNVVDVTINGNATYTAYFEANVSNVTITLNNQSATTAGTESVSATVNSNTNLTSAISVPSKTGRHFGGYYTGTNGTGVQIIDSNGNFIASAGGNNTYLDGSKNWKYASNITLNAYWYYTISATASGNGSVSGAGNYYEGSNTNLTATPSNSDYYLYDWEKNGVSLGVCTNPLVQSITADASYTAVFSAREVVNITASDDLVLTNGGSYWSVSGAGTDGNSNNYTMNIRFDSGNLTGTFNSGVNTSNTWVQKSGSSKVYAQSISVATVTEPSTGILQIVATIIGADEKKYVITGDYDKPLTAQYGVFSWDDSNDQIETGTWVDNSDLCYSDWYPHGNATKGVYIKAWHKNQTSNNYICIYFLTDNSTTYAGNVGPLADSYDVEAPYDNHNQTIGGCSNAGYSVRDNSVWYWTVNKKDIVVDYAYSEAGDIPRYMCKQSTFWGGYNGEEVTPATQFTGFHVVVASGKDGKMFVKLLNSSNNAAVIIGAPKASRKVTVANPGNGKTITVKDAQNNTYATGTEHRIPEGTVLTITVSTTDNTRVTEWTGTNSGEVTGSGTTYSLTVGAKNYDIAATFEADTYTITWKSEDGTSTLETDNNVAYNGATTFNGTSPTKTATAQYAYTFDGWATSANGDLAYANGSTPNATANATYYAHFNATTRTYTVTIVSNNTDYGTVSHASVINVPYGTVITTNNNTISVNGTTVTATKATDDESYTYAFDGWTNGTATVTGDLTVTATFTATPNITEFNLEDSYAFGDSYYTTYNTLIGRTIDITYKRSFKAGRWATFSLPFGYSFQTHSEDNPFKDQVFELTSVDYADGRMVINCVKNSTGIVANKPYILIPTSDIDNPTFEGVTPKAIAAGSKTVNNTKDDVYTVEFISTAYKQVMPTGKRTIYISGNRLYYANVDTDIPAFRGYFNLKGGDDVLHIQPRLVIAAPDGETIEQAEEAVAETRKYIENGILVIERNGIKYDAQGHIIK